MEGAVGSEAAPMKRVAAGDASSPSPRKKPANEKPKKKKKKRKRKKKKEPGEPKRCSDCNAEGHSTSRAQACKHHTTWLLKNKKTKKLKALKLQDKLAKQAAIAPVCVKCSECECSAQFDPESKVLLPAGVTVSCPLHSGAKPQFRDGSLGTLESGVVLCGGCSHDQVKCERCACTAYIDPSNATVRS